MKDTTAVSEIPVCNFCEEDAEYDGQTIFGPWAYMCKRCFRKYGRGLGLGQGQKLVLLKGGEKDDSKKMS